MRRISQKIYTKPKAPLKQSQQKEHLTPVEMRTLALSLIAVVVSIATLYVQFFYERHLTTASFIDLDFDTDSLISSKIIYHNKGNQYETILRNTIIFHQAKNLSKKQEIRFSLREASPAISYREEFDPVVLSPGQQVYRDIKQPFDFRLIENELNLNDTIRLSAEIGYLNNNGYYSTNVIPMGWLLLDSQKTVKYWKAEYMVQELESDEYFKNSYILPK